VSLRAGLRRCLPEEPLARRLGDGDQRRVPQPPVSGERVEALFDAARQTDSMEAVLTFDLREDRGRCGE
jgi:hypothetical protein